MNGTSSWGWKGGQPGYQIPQCVLLQVASPNRSDQFGLIRVNGRVMTNPVVINHSSKTVCNSENCALGKFTVKGVSETQRGEVRDLDNYCRIVWLMSSSVA